MKNIVFIPYIKRTTKLGDSGVAKPRWDTGYDYGIDSWKKVLPLNPRSPIN